MDIRQYAYCLDELIRSDGLRHAMGKEAQECALKNFTAGPHIGKLLDIYRQVGHVTYPETAGPRVELCGTHSGTGICS